MQLNPQLLSVDDYNIVSVISTTSTLYPSHTAKLIILKYCIAGKLSGNQ